MNQLQYKALVIPAVQTAEPDSDKREISEVFLSAVSQSYLFGSQVTDKNFILLQTDSQ